MNRPKKSKPVGVLTKTFQLLDLVQNSASPLNLKELSEQSRINKSTALRILAHLETVNYVTRNGRGEYTPGPGLPHAAGSADWQATLRRIARPHLWELWRATQESVNLGVLEGSEVVYVDCLESSHEFRLVAHVGMRAVPQRTALGKAMLAFMPAERREAVIGSLVFQAFTARTIVSADCLRAALARVREEGYAIDDEESHAGLRCIAAPILNARGEAVGGVSVSGPTGRVTSEAVPGVAGKVIEAAQAISARILE